MAVSAALSTGELLHVPGLTDSAETAARLAAGKHLLETYLGKALILKPAPKVTNVAALLTQFQEHYAVSAAAATASD